MLREIARLAKDKPSAAELERAKNRIQFGFYESVNNNSSKARFLGHYEAVAGDFTLGLKHYEQVPKVTAEDVQRVARQYLNPNGRTVITGVSK
jgi:zinc protease